MKVLSYLQVSILLVSRKPLLFKRFVNFLDMFTIQILA